MNKNLGYKLILIIGTLLVFMFGIFGVPKSFSGQGLLAVDDRTASIWVSISRAAPT